MHRRNFLKAIGITGSGLAASAALPLGWSSAAHADTDDYKALVCVFLLGGMDNHDTLIPYSSAGYNSWAGIRRELLGRYSGRRDRSNLLPLTSSASEAQALPPELSGLHGLYASGQAAVVSNVGPLVQPLDRAAFEAGSVVMPPRLFSHNDQQAVWMSSSQRVPSSAGAATLPTP